MTSDRQPASRHYAAAHEWQTQRAWRTHLRETLDPDAAARREFWEAQPRRALLAEARRVLVFTPPAALEEWGSRRLASVIVNGQRRRVLDYINAGNLGAAASELARLLDRSRAPDQGVC